MTTSSNQHIREAAVVELGPAASSEIPPSTRKLPGPPEPVATAMLESLLSSIGQREVGKDGNTTIGLRQLRNQSRCTGGEFGAFKERLAALLTNLAADSHIKFTNDASVETQYEMQGAAYLTTSEGFDVWELFLSLTPSSQSWAVWTAEGPIRAMRNPRSGQPQILAPQ